MVGQEFCDFKKYIYFYFSLILLIFVLNLLSVWAGTPNLCCPPGEETNLEKKICQNGKSISIKCENGTGQENVFLVYLPFEHLGNYTFDDNMDLLSDLGPISKTQYCTDNTYGYELVVYCTEVHVEETISNVINSITLTISSFFLLLTIIIYLIVPGLLDLTGICIVHTLSGLALSFICFVVVYLTYLEQELCEFFAFAIYFTFVYSLFWLNTLAFHIWRSTISPKGIGGIKVKTWKIIYHIYGIGGPLILLTILLNLNYLEYFKESAFNPSIGKGVCWFETMELTFIFFHIPMLIIIGINTVLFTWTFVYLWKNLSSSNPDYSIKKYRLKMCIKLFFVMGVSWLFEFFSLFAKYMEYTLLDRILIITDILNGLMGLIIFLILVVCRKKVMRGLAERTLCGHKFPAKWRHQTDDEMEDSPHEYTLTYSY